MSSKISLKGTWESEKNKINCKISLISFQEEGKFIVFCPAIHLSGYGNTEEEAKSSFEVVLSEYFRYTANKKTITEDIAKHGWTIKRNMRKGATPPPISELLETNEDFNRIFNTYEFKKTDTTIEIPCFA